MILSETPLFTWGDFVRVKDTAPSEYHPGQFADVCGIDQIMTFDRASAFGRDIGTYVYIIEFGDGSSLEAPGDCLERSNEEGTSPTG